VAFVRHTCNHKERQLLNVGVKCPIYNKREATGKATGSFKLTTMGKEQLNKLTTYRVAFVIKIYLEASTIDESCFI